MTQPAQVTGDQILSFAESLVEILEIFAVAVCVSDKREDPEFVTIPRSAFQTLSERLMKLVEDARAKGGLV